jgi:hypothetical protein
MRSHFNIFQPIFNMIFTGGGFVFIYIFYIYKKYFVLVVYTHLNMFSMIFSGN